MPLTHDAFILSGPGGPNDCPPNDCPPDDAPETCLAESPVAVVSSVPDVPESAEQRGILEQWRVGAPDDTRGAWWAAVDADAAWQREQGAGELGRAG